MRKIIPLLIIALISITTFGQTNFEKFKKLFKEKDSNAIVDLLQQWEKENPNDPEFYTSAFNFYFANSKQEILSLQQEEPNNDALQLTDSLGKVAGYLTSEMTYKSKPFEKAIIYINKGIEKFPNRLDIWFGKCYALGQVEDYPTFTNTLIQVIDQSTINKNKWLWTKNEPVEDGEKFMLSTIQTYLKQLYDTEDDDLLPNMIMVGEKVLKHYPNNIEILSTTAIALMLTKQYDKAINYLKQAEKLNPTDFIVLNNIAQGYRLKGEKENAIKYYELIAKHGDKQAQEQAKYYIEQLKK